VETQTLYPPVDLDEFDPEAYSGAPKELRDELGLGDAGPVVGTIGNVNPAKGHQYLIEAVPDILEQFPDAKFLIVGPKLQSQHHYFEKLQEMVAGLDIEDAVQFTGWRSDTPELLSLFDLFVLPSITEACPIVVLEAMAMQCPVVATNVGGVSEQLPSEEYGWVIPPEDSTALGEAVIQALSSSKLSHVINHARERVENTFSLRKCANDHAEVYNSCTKNKNI
jgi:glycosyltransferase involved in cell wall biosynthesis